MTFLFIIVGLTFLTSIAALGMNIMRIRTLTTLVAMTRRREQDLQEAVDASVRMLDTIYSEIATLTERYVHLDTPEVRRTVTLIREARRAVAMSVELLGDVVQDENPDAVEYSPIEGLDNSWMMLAQTMSDEEIDRILESRRSTRSNDVEG